MSILDNVTRKMGQILADDGTLGKQNQQLAIAAIVGGLGSPAWETYMAQYVDRDDQGLPDDPRQLMRLMGTDDTAGNQQMQEARAYLVANAVCAQGTGEGLTRTITNIDEGL